MLFDTLVKLVIQSHLLQTVWVELPFADGLCVFVLFHRLAQKMLHGTPGETVHFKVRTVDFSLSLILSLACEGCLCLSGRQQFALFFHDVQNHFS